MSIFKHKAINQRSIHLFNRYLENYPEISLELEDNKKAEFGFYFLFMSYVHNLSLEQCKELIIDNEFCKIVENKGNEDYGIDAFYIDYESREIFLYTFKYRHNYSEGEQSPNPFYIAQKFLDELKALFNKDQDIDEINLDKYSDKTKEAFTRILEAVKSTPDIFDFYLYQVSNQVNPPQNLTDIRRVKESTSFLTDVNSFVLADIYNLLFKDRKEINSRLDINYDRQLSYQADSASTIKHYALSLSLVDLVAITCNDEQIRMNNFGEKIDNVELEINILYDNVRGYILKSSYNKDMLETLETTPENFFIFNNGITIVVDSLDVRSNGVKKTLLFNLEKMQIVNGGQTLRTIYKYIQENPETWIDKLDRASILVKIVDTSSDKYISSNVARYTNSQNPVSPYDLKSMDPLQIAIEEFLEGKEIRYIRKNGDTGTANDTYEKEMDMITLGQLIFSKQGNPHRASSSKVQIFKKYYEDVFRREDIQLDAYNLTCLYYSIIDKYEMLEIPYTEQKIFYIVYAHYLNKDLDLDIIIEMLESSLTEYKTEKELSIARKLLLLGFKEFFDKKCKEQELVAC